MAKEPFRIPILTSSVVYDNLLKRRSHRIKSTATGSTYLISVIFKV